MAKFPEVAILGAGKAAPGLDGIPGREVTTEEIADILRLKPVAWYKRLTGMDRRRWLYEIDPDEGVPIIKADSLDTIILGETALRQALRMAGLSAVDLDGVIHVTCSGDEPNFSEPAVALHRRLGMKGDAFADHLNSGCGGGMVAMMEAAERIASGRRRYIAVVASNCTSRHFDRHVYTMVDPEHGHPTASHLTMVLFGDGAACVILGPAEGEAGIHAGFGEVGHTNLVSLPAGAARIPPYRALPWQFTYFVRGKEVQEEYLRFMRGVLSRLRGEFLCRRDEVARYYIHPASGTMIERAFRETEFGEVVERVPAREHVLKLGNLSPAGAFYQFAEDLENSTVRIGSGQIVVFAAIGAGIHAGGFTIRL